MACGHHSLDLFRCSSANNHYYDNNDDDNNNNSCSDDYLDNSCSHDYCCCNFYDSCCYDIDGSAKSDNNDGGWCRYTILYNNYCAAKYSLSSGEHLVRPGDNREANDDNYYNSGS